MRARIEYYWRKIFELGIYTKALNGVWETVAGILVFRLGIAKLGAVASFLVRGELLEHPRDILIESGLKAIQTHGGRKFIGLYLLIHGVINIFLSIQLYRNKYWAYIITMAATGIFVIYQLHRIALYHSVPLRIATAYDIFFIWLTWHEYRYQKNKHLLSNGI